MLYSANSHHDSDARRVAGSAAAYGDRGLSATGLASPWSLTEKLPPMDQSGAVAYGCYDPPSTPAAFLSPPTLAPPGIYRATGDLRYCPPSRPNDIDATPPYFVGDRRLPPELLDRATGAVYDAAAPVRYGDTKLSLAGGAGPSDDHDCSMRSILFAGDARMRTPSTLTPPPSVFAWHGSQTCSSDKSHSFNTRSYYPSFVVDDPFCRSPVGADRKSFVLII